MNPSRQSARGFILIAVMLALIVVGAIAYLLNREGAINVDAAVADGDALRARYVAEAGLAYAEAQLNAVGNCTAPTSAITGSVGSDTFSVSSTTFSSAPLRLTLTSVATLGGGSAGASLTKTVTIYSGTKASVDVVRTSANPTAVVDTYLTNNAQTTNFGSSGTLVVDNGGKAGPILVKFNLSPTPLPANAKLISAYMSMTFKIATNSGSSGKPQQLTDITAHEITTAWDENGATYNNAKTGVPWVSFSNPAAFIPYRSSGTNTSGITLLGNGDYDPAYIAVMEKLTSSSPDIYAPAQLDTFAFGDGQLVRWNITPLVAEWLDGANNYGVLLKAEQALGLATFYSSEESSQAKRPTLTLTYQIPCGGPSVALGFKDTSTNNPISDGKTGVPVKLEITLSNPAASVANLTSGLTIGLSPVLDPVFSSTLTTPTGIAVSNPVVKSVNGCGSMTFNPAAGATSITLSGGTIPPAVGNTPGTCIVTVWVTPSAISGKVPGTYPNASYPNGAATTVIIPANSLQTSAGNNAQSASASIFVAAAVTADTYLNNTSATTNNENYGANPTIKIQNNKKKNALVKFAALGIPTSSTVLSAKIRLYITAINARTANKDLDLAINPVTGTSAWTENTGTDALPVSMDAASWTKRLSGTNWSTAGGDVSTTGATTFTLLRTVAANSWIDITIPAAALQPWVTTPASNQGFLIKVTTGTSSGADEIEFASRETPGFAPQLLVTYQ